MTDVPHTDDLHELAQILGRAYVRLLIRQRISVESQNHLDEPVPPMALLSPDSGVVPGLKTEARA